MGAMHMFCCGPRSTAAAADPPPALCGYWFKSPLSVEQRLGTTSGRRKLGIQEADASGCVAWAIVDPAEKVVEWIKGEVKPGSDMKIVAHYRGRVTAWADEKWVCSDVLVG